MKKQLTLIRHAKSSWDNKGQPDFERVLNERGQGDARRMGQALDKREITFDQVLCSSAARAKETLSLLRENLDIEDNAILYLDDLYCASVPTLIQIIQQQNSNKNNIAIVAHNPGLEDLATTLSGNSESFSTCTVMKIEFTFNDWSQLGTKTGIATLLLKPKTLSLEDY